MATENWPKTLQAAIVYFADPDTAFAEMVKFRWPDGVVKCPTCGSTEVYFTASRRVWQCKNDHSRRQFSLKVGSIMEDSPLTIDKWLVAIWLITNAKNGISSYELARAIGVTQKSAWFMLHRIRLAMQDELGGKMSGDVEVDETFIGGKARNMHASKRRRLGISQSKSMVGKVAVMGLLERHRKDDAGAQVRFKVIANRKRHQLETVVSEHVEVGSNLYSDALRSYDRMTERGYVHAVIDHAEAYVDGQVHTNGLENFWSLLKRALKGTYVSVEPFHLFRYLDEQCFRFNHRKLSDSARFAVTAAAAFGKRLTFKQLTAADTTC
jgi:transposase-like protein